MLSMKSLAAKAAANKNATVQRLGKVQDLHIDTQKRSMDLSLMLHGESQPIQLSCLYTLKDQEGLVILAPHKIRCSKPWLQEVIQLILERKPEALQFVLPSSFAPFLKLLL